MIRLKKWQAETLATVNAARVLILEGDLGGKAARIFADLERYGGNMPDGAVLFIGPSVTAEKIEAIFEIKCRPTMTDFEPVLAAKDQRRDFLDRLNHYGNKGKKRRG